MPEPRTLIAIALIVLALVVPLATCTVQINDMRKEIAIETARAAAAAACIKEETP